jgi:hypothetical protein
MCSNDAMADTSGSGFPEHDLSAAAAALRAAWRADEEEWIRGAVAHWEHRRTLVDVARDCMHRGDTVAVLVGGATFTGTLSAAGDDLLQVLTPSGHVDIQLHASLPSPVVLRVVTRAHAGGRRGDPNASTFRARLLEREADGDEVVVGSLLLAEALGGTLSVGADQVGVRDGDGSPTYLPIAWVGWITTRRG